MRPERKFALSPQQDQWEYAEPEEKRVLESEPSFRLPDWLPVDFMDRSPEERLRLLEAKAESSLQKSQEVSESARDYLDETEEEFVLDHEFDEDGRPMVNMKPLIKDVRLTREAFENYREDEALRMLNMQRAYEEQRAFQEQEILFPDTQRGTSYREAPVVRRLPSRETLDQELKAESAMNGRLRVELIDRAKELDQLKKKLAQDSRWKKWAKIGMLALGALSGAAYGQRSLERADAQALQTSYEQARAQNTALRTSLEETQQDLSQAQDVNLLLSVRAAMQPSAINEGMGGFFGNGNVNLVEVAESLPSMNDDDLSRLHQLTAYEIQDVRDDLARVSRGGVLQGRYSIGEAGMLSPRLPSREIQSALKEHLEEMENFLQGVERQQRDNRAETESSGS